MGKQKKSKAKKSKAKKSGSNYGYYGDPLKRPVSAAGVRPDMNACTSFGMHLGRGGSCGCP